MVKDEYDLVINALTAVRIIRHDCGDGHPSAERIREVADKLEVGADRLAEGPGGQSNTLARALLMSCERHTAADFTRRMQKGFSLTSG